MSNRRNKQSNGASKHTSSDLAAHESLSEGNGVGIEGQVRTRAYELYLERGNRPSDAVGDWLRAERECLAHSLDETSRAHQDGSVAIGAE